MSRTQLTSHNIAMYKAMKRLDVLDELYPSQFATKRNTSSDMAENTEKRNEQPSVTDKNLKFNNIKV